MTDRWMNDERQQVVTIRFIGNVNQLPVCVAIESQLLMNIISAATKDIFVRSWVAHVGSRREAWNGRFQMNSSWQNRFLSGDKQNPVFLQTVHFIPIDLNAINYFQKLFVIQVYFSKYWQVPVVSEIFSPIIFVLSSSCYGIDKKDNNFSISLVLKYTAKTLSAAIVFTIVF